MKKVILSLASLCLVVLLFACGSRTSISSNEDTTADDTELSANSSTEETNSPKGIVMASVHWGQYGENDVDHIDLSLLSPEDGSIEPYKTFNYPTQTSDGKDIINFSLSRVLANPNVSDSRVYFTRPFYAKKGFDKALKNIAVTFKLKDSDSERVGILNDNGELTDISAIIEGDENSFTSKRFRHIYPYIENEYFYFTSTDTTYYNSKLFRIPLNNLTSGAVEEINLKDNRLGNSDFRKIYLDENNEYFFVNEDRYGKIYLHRTDETFGYDGHTYDIALYLGDGQYLSSGFSLYNAFKEPATGDPENYGKNAEFVKNVIPQNERRNYSPILSPDKSQIMFLSTSRASNQTEPTLYKVPKDGGNPEAIVQKFEPLAPSDSDLKGNDTVFLDWIE